MSFNVLGNWRFAVANKGLRSKTSNRKMWRSKTARRRLRRLRFCVARTAEQAVSSYRLLRLSDLCFLIKNLAWTLP